MTTDLRVILFLWVVCLFCSLGYLRQSDLLGLFALCFLSVCLHEDIIVILCPVSLSVVWDIRLIRVIWGFFISLGVSVFSVIFLLWRFEMVV